MTYSQLLGIAALHGFAIVKITFNNDGFEIFELSRKYIRIRIFNNNGNIEQIFYYDPLKYSFVFISLNKALDIISDNHE